MGSRARARRTAAALGVTGLLFAVLGAVMIVVLPWIIKQQVIKVCGGRRPGPASAADAWATRSRVQSPAPGPLSTEERRGHREGQQATSPVPARSRLRLGAWGRI